MDSPLLAVSPEFAGKAWDVLGKVLGQAENHRSLAECLTHELRELSQAACVLLIQCQGQRAGRDHLVLGFSPEERGAWSSSEAACRIYEAAHDASSFQVWPDQAPPELAELLRSEDFPCSLFIPLNISRQRVGALLILGMPSYRLVDTLSQWSSTLAPCVALALQNSILFSRQEQAIRERTEELRSINETLRAREAETRELLEINERTRRAMLDSMEDQQRAQTALRENEQRFRTILQNIPAVAVHSYRPDGTVLYWNDASERFYGYSREEAVGANLLDLIIPPDMREEVRRLISSESDIPASELRLMRKDGSRIDVFSSHCAIRMPGKETEMYCIDIDLTEHKRFEEQYLRAQRMESIGTLAGGIAHDLNNALSPILMSIDLMRFDEEDPERLSLIETIERSATHAAELVRQVLTFARGTRGDYLPIDLHDLAREMRTIIQDTFPKDIEFRLHAEPNLWKIRADATQVRQVFMNLAVNSRDAMPAGGIIELELRNLRLDGLKAGMHPDAKPGHYVLAAFRDTGPGIPGEIRDRVFDPFFTTKEVGKGTGLGLSTTQSILRGHGGFLTIEQPEGPGALFHLCFPALPGEDGIQERSGLLSTVPPGQGETILVVDDEDGILNITRKTLENHNYRVLTARNGAEGVSCFARNQGEIRLVITDMAMPVMDGPAMIVALRAIQPNVRIIGSSGYASSTSQSKIASCGVRHFLSKPYSADLLLQTIREVLDADKPA